MLVLYGSQTGTAKNVAEMISRKLIRRHLTVFTSAIDEYSIENITEENVIIFVVATTGQGEPTDNMKKFWKLLWRRCLPKNCFTNVKFAVAGLGDSSYQNYNFVSKKLYKRLLQLGGCMLLPLALADDQHPYGYCGAIIPWLTNLLEKIDEIYPPIIEPMPDHILLPPNILFSLQPHNSDHQQDIVDKMDNMDIGFDQFFGSLGDAKEVSVISNQRLTPTNHWQDVRLITLRLDSSMNSFLPGYVCSVWPKNSQENVFDFLSLFNLNKMDFFYIKSQNKKDNSYPRSGFLETLVKNFLDIHSQPQQSFWEFMWHFATSEMEKEKFKEFLSLEGQEELYSYCNRPRRTILEVLNDFIATTSNIDLSYLMDLIPLIRPRSFSIASAPNSSGEFQLLVALVEYKTSMKKLRKGLCSNFLASLQKSDKLYVQIKETQLKFSMEVPLIMIGPGTGVASFRSIIQFRASKNIGDNFLFFGCRNASKDYFFRDEWQDLERKGLLKIFTAFSRDQNDKIYVQHLISDQKDLIWSLLQRNACIYVAGSSKNMPDQVYEALLQAIISVSEMEKNEAEKLLQLMKKNGKYQMETWS